MFSLFLSDSLSKSKKEFFCPKKILDKPINIYVCGITPYDHAHIGHARCYVTFDILVRLIRYFDGKVTYVQNVTDVNEKIFDKALAEYGDESYFQCISNRYFEEFRKLLQSMGCLNADYYPHVSQSIAAIISLIQDIISAGYGYEKEDGVYFDVTKYREYGQLSQRTIDIEMISRLEGKFEKKSDYDFVLWKKNSNSTVSWDSPWGKGLPGWHIECSAMIKDAFQGESLDLHGGGLDLIFPHHENERAQSECASCKPLAHVWMHVAFMQINNDKMSKSLGNSIYLKDMLTQYDPMVLRFYFLMHHYKAPINFSYVALDSAKKAYQSFVSIFENIELSDSHLSESEERIFDEICASLFDDLNTSLAIGIIFKYKEEIIKNKPLYNKIKKIIQYVLGLSLIKEESIQTEQCYSEEVQLLLVERQNAREEKNFIKADEIRKKLLAMGVDCIVDEKLSK